MTEIEKSNISELDYNHRPQRSTGIIGVAITFNWKKETASFSSVFQNGEGKTQRRQFVLRGRNFDRAFRQARSDFNTKMGWHESENTLNIRLEQCKTYLLRKLSDEHFETFDIAYAFEGISFTELSG